MNGFKIKSLNNLKQLLAVVMTGDIDLVKNAQELYLFFQDIHSIRMNIENNLQLYYETIDVQSGDKELPDGFEYIPVIEGEGGCIWTIQLTDPRLKQSNILSTLKILSLSNFLSYINLEFILHHTPEELPQIVEGSHYTEDERHDHPLDYYRDDSLIMAIPEKDTRGYIQKLEEDHLNLFPGKNH